MEIKISFYSENFLDLYLMKIQINFLRKIFRYVFNENTDQFYSEKISNLYLMKI